MDLNLRMPPWLRAELIPLGVVLFLTPWLMAPVQGHHAWRQSDVSAVARNLATESPDIFHPRIDLRGDKTGITGMEFPLYPAIVAVLMAVTRSEADVWGRLVSLFMTAGCWLLLVRIMTRRWGINPWAAHAACAAVPIFPGYSVMFMPESTALALAVASVVLLDAWWVEQRPRLLLWCSASLALAALVRPYVIFWGLGLLVAWVVALRRDRDKALPLLLAGLGALIPFGLWYFLWCPHLVETYGLDYFYTGGALVKNLRLLASRGFWAPFNQAFGYYLRYSLTPLALLGAGVAFGVLQKTPRIWWDACVLVGIPVLTPLGVGLVSGGHLIPHMYYLIGMVPAVVFLLAFSLDLVLRTVRPVFPLMVLYVVMESINTIPAKMSYKDPAVDLVSNVLPEVSARVAREDLVIVEDMGGQPWHLQQIHRRGWVEARQKLEDPQFLEAAAQGGARWVVYLEPASKKYALMGISQWRTQLSATEAPPTP